MWRSVAECGGVWRSVAECGECGMQVDIITNDSLSQLSETVSQKKPLLTTRTVFIGRERGGVREGVSEGRREGGREGGR